MVRELSPLLLVTQTVMENSCSMDYVKLIDGHSSGILYLRAKAAPSSRKKGTINTLLNHLVDFFKNASKIVIFDIQKT